MSEPHITELRTQLLATLADLRNRENPMEPDRARAVAQVASVLVDSAKVEVDYLKATGQQSAPFLETPPDAPYVGIGAETHHVQRIEGGGNGIASITRHTLKG